MFTKTRFDSLQLPDSIMQGIASLGWECLTEVQRDTIPMLALVKTSSARLEPVRVRRLRLVFQFSSDVSQLEVCKAWFLPTRELAQQVAEEMNQLQGDAGLSIMTVYGGTDLEKQAKGLDDGVDLIVGTPGRVMDMSERGHLDLAKIEIFVLMKQIGCWIWDSFRTSSGFWSERLLVSKRFSSLQRSHKRFLMRQTSLPTILSLS